MNQRIETVIKEAIKWDLEAWPTPEGIAETILAALKAARIECVGLPEATLRWDCETLAWPVNQTWHGEPDRQGEVSIRKSDGRIGVTEVSLPCEPTGARSLAAALLAAADAAEVDQ